MSPSLLTTFMRLRRLAESSMIRRAKASISAIIMRLQLIQRYDDCRVPTSVCGGLSEVSAKVGILEVKGRTHYVITTHTCTHR